MIHHSDHLCMTFRTHEGGPYVSLLRVRFSRVDARGVLQLRQVLPLEHAEPQPFARRAPIDYELLEMDFLHLSLAFGALQDGFLSF
jgi:hypothetical protein